MKLLPVSADDMSPASAGDMKHASAESAGEMPPPSYASQAMRSSRSTAIFIEFHCNCLCKYADDVSNKPPTMRSALVPRSSLGACVPRRCRGGACVPRSSLGAKDGGSARKNSKWSTRTFPYTI